MCHRVPGEFTPGLSTNRQIRSRRAESCGVQDECVCVSSSLQTVALRQDKRLERRLQSVFRPRRDARKFNCRGFRSLTSRQPGRALSIAPFAQRTRPVVLSEIICGSASSTRDRLLLSSWLPTPFSLAGPSRLACPMGDKRQNLVSCGVVYDRVVLSCDIGTGFDPLPRCSYATCPTGNLPHLPHGPHRHQDEARSAAFQARSSGPAFDFLAPPEQRADLFLPRRTIWRRT